MKFSDDGWLILDKKSSLLRIVASPNKYDTRPKLVSLLVIHCISLPEGEYGNGYIEQFFSNQLDSTAHPSFNELIDIKVSSHFLIARQGDITQFVSIDACAWHAGISNWLDEDSCNDYSIGIELEGSDYSQFTDRQYQSLQQLTITIQNRHPQITQQRIVGHSDIAPNRKTDPGPGFDWLRYKQSLT